VHVLGLSFNLRFNSGTLVTAIGGKALLMLGFYVIFALNNVIDSYFYGGAFAAYQAVWFVPTLDRIAVIFGLGITMDAIITFGLYFWLRKQSKAVF